jgi:hypothetical protein
MLQSGLKSSCAFANPASGIPVFLQIPMNRRYQAECRFALRVPLGSTALMEELDPEVARAFIDCVDPQPEIDRAWNSELADF